MPIGNNILAGSSGQATGYDIDQSLRFNDGDSAYLSRTPGSAGNLDLWTFSCWAKRGAMGAAKVLFSAQVSSSHFAEILFTATDDLLFEDYNFSGEAPLIRTNAKYRDPSAWYHVVAVYDSANATANSRMRLYVNGEEVTDLQLRTNPSSGYDGVINRAVVHRIGDYNGSTFYDGYLAEVIFLDGIAASVSDLGELNSATNQWVPIKYTGTYPGNSFYLPFSATELANSFTDSSSSSHTITANGDVANTRAQKKIGSSSIKFDGSGDYLSCADSNDWSFGTGDFTLETWVRFNDSAGSENLFSQYQSGSNRWYLSADLTNNTLGFYDAGSGMDVEQTVVTWVADTWYHVAMVRSSGTVTYYVNGTAYTVTGTNPSGNITSNTGSLQIGRYNTGDDLNGYLDEIRISNSARYTGAFTPSTTAFTDDSNTKLLIHSDFNGGIGADSSGNKNDFTPVNLVSTDVMTGESPTNNFATLNPLDAFNSMTATEGNLRANTNSGSDPKINATFQIPQSGKWYWEFVDQHGLSIMVGVIDQTNSGNVYGNNNSVLYSSGLGTKYNFSSVSSYGASWTTGDIIGVAINRDDNEITFYKNNSSQGTFTIGGTAAQRARLIPVIGTGTGGTGGGTFNFGQDSSFHGTKTAQGNGGDGEDFYYTPPTGYKSLSTKSLDDPAIALPTAHFDSKLYTGTGSSQSITTGLQPDFSWIKSRSQTASHALFDTVRGATKELISNADAAEQTFSDSLTAFTSDGFTVGADTSGAHVNVNSQTYVSWNWKAASSNTSVSAGSIDGTNPTIATTRRTNTTSGFSIITYSGNGSSGQTISHGLSQAPDMTISFNRDGGNPWVWHKDLSSGAFNTYIQLNAADAFLTNPSSGYFTAMSASTLTMTTGSSSIANLNTSGDDYLLYAFHEIDGYSKIGSYESNNSTDGPFCFTGFSPAYVLLKCTNATDNWNIYDNKRNGYNGGTYQLRADSNAAGFTSAATMVDLVSNGFKIRTNDPGTNGSGRTYLYLAFAESPFKTSNGV